MSATPVSLRPVETQIEIGFELARSYAVPISRGHSEPWIDWTDAERELAACLKKLGEQAKR